MEHFTLAQATICSCHPGPSQVSETAVDPHAVNVAEYAQGIMKIEGEGVGQRRKRSLDIQNDRGAGVLDKENILPRRASNRLVKRATVTALVGSKRRRREEGN